MIDVATKLAGAGGVGGASRRRSAEYYGGRLLGDIFIAQQKWPAAMVVVLC